MDREFGLENLNKKR